jgi:thiosulfate reductase/polysulfide reductase chain A
MSDERTILEKLLEAPAQAPVTRRDVLRWGAVTSAAAALLRLPSPFRPVSEAEAAELSAILGGPAFPTYAGGAWTKSCCNMCGGQCGVLAYVDASGRVRKVEPNRDYGANVSNINDPKDAKTGTAVGGLLTFASAAAETHASGKWSGLAADTGRLCIKGNAPIRSLYDPDRLQRPLRRVGPRGSGQFEPISWEEAIEESARRLKEIRRRYGARSLVWFGEDHSFTHVQQDFCDAFGTPNYHNHSNLCDTSRKALYLSTIGADRPLADMANADLLVVFGWNFLSALKWIHLASIFTRGRDRGMEFVYIDPVFNTTASKADRWIAVRPGTDGALGLALCKAIIDAGAMDTAFRDAYTFGYDEFEAFLAGDGTYDPEKTPEWASDITGVPAGAGDPGGTAEPTPKGSIRWLAWKIIRAKAQNKRICIDVWSGPGHHTNATQGGRAIAALNVLLGAVDKPGTMVFPLRSGPGRPPSVSGWPGKDGWRLDGKDDVTIPATEPFAVTSDRDLVDVTGATFDAGDDLRGKKFNKKYLYSHGSGIYTEARDAMIAQRDFLGIPYPIKAAVFVFQNFVMSTPNTEKNLRAIGEMEFVLCVDTHLSETAMMADIVIPGSQYLERYDYNAAWVTYRTLGLRQPAVRSWFGGRSESQFLLDLGQAMGFAGFKAERVVVKAGESDPPRPADLKMFIEADEQYTEAEWVRFMATGNGGKPWANQMTFAQLKSSGVWTETGSAGGTQFEKHKKTSAFDAAKMEVKTVTAGGQTVYVVYGTNTDPTKRTPIGIAPSASFNSGTFEVGFNTETRRCQLWDPKFERAFVAQSDASKQLRPAGRVVVGDPAFHPLPWFKDPDFKPTSAFPLYFISWKEVEHTHTRTFNNAWLMEARGVNDLLVHPDTAGPLGLVDGDSAWVESPFGQVRARVQVTKRIHPECVGWFRGFGHWALGSLAKGKGTHDGWLLPGVSELHSGQAVHKEVGVRIWKALL